MKTRKLVAVFILASAAGSATAHHSFAPHFDPDSSITITGTIIEFEGRNPHTYLHIEAKNGSGELREYICESSGIRVSGLFERFENMIIESDLFPANYHRSVQLLASSEPERPLSSGNRPFKC